MAKYENTIREICRRFTKIFTREIKPLYGIYYLSLSYECCVIPSSSSLRPPSLSSPRPPGRLQRSSSFTDQRPAAISEPVDLKKARQPPRTPPPSLSSTYKPPRPQVAQKPVWLSQKRKPIARAEEEKEEGKKEEVDEGGVDDYVDPQVFLDDFSRTLEVSGYV